MAFFLSKKKIITTILFLFFYIIIHAQNYVDLVKINYANIFNTGYEGSNTSTNVLLMDASFTYPIKLNEKFAIITGIDYSQQSLKLNPYDHYNTALNNLTFKLGMSIKHSEKLSGTYVFLPRLSSEGLHSNGNDLFFGGIALLKYQKTKNLQWRFGAYTSSEGFGILMTPVLGLHYLSRNKKFQITANLPINADVNYTLGRKTSLGFGFQAPVKSYSLNIKYTTQYYVQVSNIEFGPYFETRFLDDSLLLRLQTGYSTVSYEVFKENDTLPIRLSAIEFGDDRALQNPEMSGGLFARVGFIYRFHLNKN